MSRRAATVVAATVTAALALVALPSVASPADSDSPAIVTPADVTACSYPWVEPGRAWSPVSSPVPVHTACEKCPRLVDPTDFAPRQQMWWQESTPDERRYGVLDVPICRFLLHDVGPKGWLDATWWPVQLPSLPADARCDEPKMPAWDRHEPAVADEFELCLLPRGPKDVAKDAEVALGSENRLAVRERSSGRFLTEAVMKVEDSHHQSGIRHTLLTVDGTRICTFFVL